jgi:hypothetical protein
VKALRFSFLIPEEEKFTSLSRSSRRSINFKSTEEILRKGPGPVPASIKEEIEEDFEAEADDGTEKEEVGDRDARNGHT